MIGNLSRPRLIPASETVSTPVLNPAISFPISTRLPRKTRQISRFYRRHLNSGLAEENVPLFECPRTYSGNHLLSLVHVSEAYPINSDAM